MSSRSEQSGKRSGFLLMRSRVCEIWLFFSKNTISGLARCGDMEKRDFVGRLDTDETPASSGKRVLLLRGIESSNNH